MIMLLLFFSLTISERTDPMENVIEEPESIGFDRTTRDLKVKKYIRAYAHDDRIELRSAADGGSLLVLEDANPNDNWSLSYTIKNPKLRFPERAGIYIWYTDQPLKEGMFSGSDGDFTGSMIGIEFLGRSMSITVAINDGSNDYTGLNDHDISTIKDSMDPSRITRL